MSVTAEVGAVRGLTAVDLPAVERLLGLDPVAHCLVISRIRLGGLDPWRAGGEFLGFFVDDELRSLLYCGANLVPVETSAAAREAFAQRLRSTGRRSSSIVGPSEEVLDLWDRLARTWGVAREIRESQPLLAIDGPPRVRADARVRPAEARDLEILVPACIDMFTAEVGVSPVTGGMESAYRARIAELVALGRSFVRVDGDMVVFKAEVGAAHAGACQVQGVWVDPSLRGTGLSEAGMAAVVELAQSSISSIVSLYVNDFNVPARRCYEAVGFEQVGEFATVLF